nr:MFS transporter [Streptomyces alboflavus]
MRLRTKGQGQGQGQGPAAGHRYPSARGEGPAAGERDPWRYRWAVLGIATFTQAAAGFFVQGIGALGISLQRDLDLNTAQLGMLVSASQLVPLVGLLVAGELLDRYNERWVVGIGACVVAVALGVGSAAPGYVALLCVLLVVGAGYSTVQPGGSKSVASWFDTSRRGFAMGVRQAGLPLGAALASAVLPLLAEAHGWRSTLVVGGSSRCSGRASSWSDTGARRQPCPGCPCRPRRPPLGCAGRTARSALRAARRPAAAAPRALHGDDPAVRGEPDIRAVRGGRPDGPASARGGLGRSRDGGPGPGGRPGRGRGRPRRARGAQRPRPLRAARHRRPLHGRRGRRDGGPDDPAGPHPRPGLRCAGLARLLRLRLVRAVGRPCDRVGPGGPDRVHPRPRHVRQPGRHRPDAARARPAPGPDRQLHRRLGSAVRADGGGPGGHHARRPPRPGQGPPGGRVLPDTAGARPQASSAAPHRPD